MKVVTVETAFRAACDRASHRTEPSRRNFCGTCSYCVASATRAVTRLAYWRNPIPTGRTERSRRRRRTCSAVITNAALCAECLAKKINVPADRVKMTLMRISKTLNVTNAGAGCDACRTSTKVFRLA